MKVICCTLGLIHYHLNLFFSKNNVANYSYSTLKSRVSLQGGRQVSIGENEGEGMVALGFGKSLIMLVKLVILNNPLSLSLSLSQLFFFYSFPF